MRTLVCDHTVWRLLEVGSYGELVAHCSACDEQCIFMAGELGYIFLEIVCCFVFLEYIVQETRLRYGSKHR